MLSNWYPHKVNIFIGMKHKWNSSRYAVKDLVFTQEIRKYKIFLGTINYGFDLNFVLFLWNGKEWKSGRWWLRYDFLLGACVKKVCFMDVFESLSLKIGPRNTAKFCVPDELFFWNTKSGKNNLDEIGILFLLSSRELVLKFFEKYLKAHFMPNWSEINLPSLSNIILYPSELKKFLLVLLFLELLNICVIYGSTFKMRAFFPIIVPYD